jgi:hypothetical protein
MRVGNLIILYDIIIVKKIQIELTFVIYLKKGINLQTDKHTHETIVKK